MELTNEFRVPLPVERAWELLTDVERIAPCMPGAQLQEVAGDEYRGIVKVKVGPITAQYKGQATFVERDEASHRAVLRAEGRETRGQGNASATITAALAADGDGTVVSVLTDLTVTGKVAQFGRGVLSDVSAKLLGEFVACLEADLLSSEPAAEAPQGSEADPGTESGAAAAQDAPAPEGAAASGGSPATGAEPRPTDAPGAAPAASEATPGAPAVRKIDMPEPTPVDLLDVAGSPIAKRVGPILGLVTIAWLLRVLLRRRRR